MRNPENHIEGEKGKAWGEEIIEREEKSIRETKNKHISDMFVA